MVKRFNLYLDRKLEVEVVRGRIHLRAFARAKRVYEELTLLPIMRKAYACPSDLSDISYLSLLDYRYNLIDKFAEANRCQASILFFSPDKIRLSIALIKKGEKDYFYHVSFLFNSDGGLYKAEHDPQ